MEVLSLAYVEKKVAALHRLHGLAKMHHESVVEILRPFVGQKIVLADGRYIKSIRDKLHSLSLRWANEFNGKQVGWHNWLERSDYTIFDSSRLDLRDAAYDGSRETVAVDSWLAKLDGPNLEEVNGWKDRPSYDVAQTMADLERLARLAKEVKELESHYRPILRS